MALYQFVASDGKWRRFCGDIHADDSADAGRKALALIQRRGIFKGNSYTVQLRCVVATIGVQQL